MASSLRLLVAKIIKIGTLTVRGPAGEQRFGGGGGRSVTLRFTDDAAEAELAADPALKLGELYMDGRLIVEEGDIYDFLALVKENTLSEGLTFGMLWRGLARIAVSLFRNRVPINHNRRNVAHHYDLDEHLFALFLDPDWQYSCAYFHPPGISLEEAQLAKKRHIAAKLLLRPGHRVLEIGSGWGGMAMYLSEAAGVDVTGITLSQEQLKISRERAQQRNLAEKVRFQLQDYRTYRPAERFDRIVSVGMFEHVGRTNYRNFFRKVNQFLADDGVMVLHSIGQPSVSYVTNPFIEKYIFPGGYIPALSEVLPHIERAGLLISDIEILPMHYAHTLHHWRQRFLARKADAVALYDERFFRMWDFYLAGSEMAFTHENFFIFQIQLKKSRDAVPHQRDYIAMREEELKKFEAKRRALEPVELM
ncbi:cyclopropane-fatty-acyl-phospholipid synthase [Rhizobium sp. RU35A]|uniref:SAM-dependent methyltransferase n=1 Tax=Rhizobium sp. RU35A TaxID=1907414 RepID=UPI000955B28C|nr:cyclopropane-fatty-acyl-phospholipid synthase family protein [Rhizobium sp. RU35A]SIP98505.1 cyclopropane-fatty-acyl-phospholipid synthase [Rhizobium sp. RU35A]